ncbi:MAG: TetR family transcriptional regulator [Phenylobacterium zucineum]|nr:MAG: TetR family transcriptional regulator [Phenylobacterium zucineum]
MRVDVSGKRLPRDERRRQLLETAAGVVRAEGTDALTLARVAEQAGVSKPVAYQHFETRAGLLVALYRHFDARRTEATRTALETQARTLDDAVAILASAYVDCVLEAGKEFGAIAAALSATEEMDDFRHAMREEYVELYREALRPFTTLPGRGGKAVILGLIGAADTLSQAAAGGRLSRKEAIASLAHIMLGALKDA